MPLSASVQALIAHGGSVDRINHTHSWLFFVLQWQTSLGLSMYDVVVGANQITVSATPVVLESFTPFISKRPPSFV